MAGQFNTSFIAHHYPNGFTGAAHGDDDAHLLVCVAATIYRRERERAVGIAGQLRGHEVGAPTEFVVRIGDIGHEVGVVQVDRGYRVTYLGLTRTLVTNWQLRDIRFEGELDGKKVALQVDRAGLRYQLHHKGATVEAQVMTARADALLRLMPTKQPPNMSAFLLSPMPGLLVDIAVSPGQEVKAGERLAVIEAMKMENVLLAGSDSVVEEVLAVKGASLAVDQPIVRFRLSRGGG